MSREPANAGTSTKRNLLILVLITGVAVGLWIWVSLRAAAPLPPRIPIPANVDQSDIANYTGNDACAPCHPTEFKSHQASHHQMALRPVTRAALGDLLPPVGRINNSQYSLVEQDGRFYFEVDPPGSPDKYQLWPLDFAFGSGVMGVSYVSMLEGRNVVEMKMSYFPAEHRWRVTPGQTMGNEAAAGNLGNLAQSRRCLGCHIIAMSKNTSVPRPEFYGVGCESCHGPGREHIAAVKNGSKDIQMADLKHLGATETNTLCGKCHRTAEDVVGTPRESMTFRFQPYGLMKSRCFLESGDRLSCQNCHDAHANVAKDVTVYERACLTCHGGSQIGPSAAATQGHGKVCPVNPTTGCIPCHMPQRDVLSTRDGHLGMSMTEHLIAVYKDKPNGAK